MLRPIYIKKPVGDQPVAIKFTVENAHEIIATILKHIPNLDEGLSLHMTGGAKKKPRGTAGMLNIPDNIEFGDEDDDHCISVGQYLVIIGEGNWEIMTPTDFHNHYGFEDERPLDNTHPVELPETKGDCDRG